jgi:1-acyl-sn-glycerol-3-phosphate acyltransferase
MRKARTPDWRFVGWPYKSLYTLVVPLHDRVLVRARGVERVPLEGGVVLASNHVVAWDPCLLQCCLPRPVLWMAKKELFGNRFTSWFFRTVGCIPVDRSRKNPEALAAARDMLSAGAIVGIFPEGTRRRDPTPGLGEGKPGAAKLALQAGVPIVPAAIAWRGKRRAFVTFGEPLRLEGDAASQEDVASGTKRVMDALAALLRESQRARDERDEAWRAP